MVKYRVLPPIKEKPEDFEAIGAAILQLLRESIYIPLIRELQANDQILGKSLKNSFDELVQAIIRGKIQYSDGQFTGKFSSTLSRELRSIGARWERKQGSFSLPPSRLSRELIEAISISKSKFRETMSRINLKLEQLSPAHIAQALSVEKLIDPVLYKTDAKVAETLKGIAIQPKITPEARDRISKEYTENLQLYIQDFTEKEITALRKRIEFSAVNGYRYETVVSEIERSYGVSYNKAKFLARQETSLLMTKFKQIRYQDAGSEEYIWGCVKMPHQQKGVPASPGDVRYFHGIHEGKKFRWDTGAVVNERGEKKNPGQDYNCRCFARPVVRF